MTATRVDTRRYFPNPHHQQEQTLSFTWNKKRSIAVARDLVRRCLAYYHKEAEAVAAGSAQAQGSRKQSLGGLYTGALGPVVYLQWRISRFLRTQCGDDAGCLEESERMIQTALEAARSAAAVEMQRMPHSIRRFTLLEGPLVGAKAMYAILLHNTGSKLEALQEANQLIAILQDVASQRAASECEVLYGRAGALQAIFLLRRELQDENLGSDTVLLLAKQIVLEGRRFAAANCQTRVPLLWEWHETKYLGAAHGVIGILHTLLSLTTAERERLDQDLYSLCKDDEFSSVSESIKETIAKLDDFCWPSGNIDSSIKESHKTDRLVQWCHGSPGYVLLIVKAHRVFGGGNEDNYLKKAQRLAGQVIWPRGLLRKGVGLCHGIAGNAYPLLVAGQAANDLSLVGQAGFFSDFAVQNLLQLENVPDRPYSLFEGLGGLALLVLDLAPHPEEERVTFPLYI